MGVGTAYFWITDREVDRSSYPEAPDLIVHAFHVFKRRFLTEQVSYKVFLQQVFNDLETQEVNYQHFIEVSQTLTTEFSRAYFLLYDNRQRIIKTFTLSDSFDKEAAAKLLQFYETNGHPRPKKKEEIDATIYERLADIANRFCLFYPEICGADLIAFRDGTLDAPLQTRNMARAVFFLSLLSARKLLPFDWKTKAVEKKLLISMRTGKVPSPKYLRSVASKYSTSTYSKSNIAVTKSKFISLTIWGQIAHSVKNISINNKR